MTITPNLFEAFLKCPTKGWFRATGEPSSGNAYAEWVTAQTEAYRAAETERLLAERPADECARSPSGENLKAAKWRLAVDVAVRPPDPPRSSRREEAHSSAPQPSTLDSQPSNQSLVTSAAMEQGGGVRPEFVSETRLHALERIPSEGRGKAAQFIPVRFIWRNKLTKDDKLLLAFDAFVLAQALGRDIPLGKIIHGDLRSCARQSAAISKDPVDGEPPNTAPGPIPAAPSPTQPQVTKVKTSALFGEVRKLLGKITALLSSPTGDQSANVRSADSHVRPGDANAIPTGGLSGPRSEPTSVPKPPDLVLNRHCAECEFRDRCRQKAIETDDLSLLAGMSAKERQKLRSKGIFTVTQLSYTFRPRRRPKRLRDKREKYHHALKALAIREKKIHIVGSPELKIEGTPVYLDVEGLPDRDFYYLIGVRIGHGDTAVQHSLWADTVADEGKIWREFLAILEAVEKPVLIHYGSYETAFLQAMRERHNNPSANSGAFPAMSSSTNIVSLGFAQIYFPTPGNGLKEIGRFLEPDQNPGMQSGLDSIVRRSAWERDSRVDAKQELLAYNEHDCLLLARLCALIHGMCMNRSHPPVGRSHPLVDFVRTDELPKVRERWEMFKPMVFALADFQLINRCAYFDYQREKVFVRTTPKFCLINRRHRKARPTRYRIDRTIRLQALHCPDCGSKPATPPVVAEHLFFDLQIGRCAVRRRVTCIHYETAYCRECHMKFSHPDRPHHPFRYGHGLLGWSVYLATYCGLNMNRTQRFLADVFGLPLPDCQFFVFRRLLAAKYEALSREILSSLLTHRSLHVDETPVNLKGHNGYVWVLASVDRVYYFYRPTRESTFLGEMLSEFDGVLVSDFYSGYDTLNCDQQKCLIHFMRDINEDILKSPFDGDLKSIAERFGSVLRAIVESVDHYGLKRRHLAKHKRAAQRFLTWVGELKSPSELANAYKKRLAKSGARMFTFLDHDGVPWNNNNAEHAIKRFVKYRRENDGRFTEESLREYLILATVFETCDFNNISVLRFLLSGETKLAGLLDMIGRGDKLRRPSWRPRPKSGENPGKAAAFCAPSLVPPRDAGDHQTKDQMTSTPLGVEKERVWLQSKVGVSKFARRWRFEAVERRSASCFGGLIAIEGVIQKFALWDRLNFERDVERRFQAQTGVNGKKIISQLLYGFCAGGDSVEDFEAIGSDILVRQLTGSRSLARISTLEAWLRDQSAASVADLLEASGQLGSQAAELVTGDRRNELERLLSCGLPPLGSKERTPSDGVDNHSVVRRERLGVHGDSCLHAIAATAQNLLASLKCLYLPEECLQWSLQSLRQRVIFLPAELFSHARRMRIRVQLPVAWQGWWQSLAEPLKLPVVSS